MTIEQGIGQRDGDLEVILRQKHDFTLPEPPFMVNRALNMARMWQKLPLAGGYSVATAELFYESETISWQGWFNTSQDNIVGMWL